MPSTNIRTTFRVRDDLVMSADQLIGQYCYGLPLFEKAGYGNTLAIIEDKILFAQTELENLLQVKFKPQVIEENCQFIMEEWGNWGFVKVSYPVAHPGRLFGVLNEVRQIQYPMAWLNTRRSNDSFGRGQTRNVYIMPNTRGGSPTNIPADGLTNAAIFTGLTPQIGFYGSRFIPNYWRISYVTGFDNGVPPDIVDVIGKIAACQFLALIADVTFGAGIASLSLGFDGFSQSLGTTQSAENSLYSARIKQYYEELFKNGQLDRLRLNYKGIQFQVL